MQFSYRRQSYYFFGILAIVKGEMYELSEIVCADYAFGGRELVREWFGIYARTPHKFCANLTQFTHETHTIYARTLYQFPTNPA